MNNAATDISRPLLTARNVALWSCALVAAALLFSVSIEKQLSADGVLYLQEVLDKGTFTIFAWSRRNANYITEWPLVLAVKAGVTDMRTLVLVQGLGIFLPYLLSFALCLYAARREKGTILLFPVASMVVINLSSDYILSGEHQVMALCTWPLLLLLLRREDWTRGDCMASWLLGFAYIRMYEAELATGMLLAVVGIIRAKSARDAWQRRALAVTCLFIFAAIACAVYFIVFPRDAINRHGFVLGMVESLRSPEAIASGLFVTLFTLALVRRIPIIYAAIPVAVYGVVCMPTGWHAPANVSFSCRTLCMTALPLLMLAAIAVWRAGSSLDRRASVVFLVFMATMTVCDMRHNAAWLLFRHEMRELLATRTGYIAVEGTQLVNNRCRWQWNNTLLSLVWSAPHVHSILLNDPGIRWEPFDPRKDRPLARYVEYDDGFRVSLAK